MDLNHEIDAVVARLSAGEDPRPILTAFARAVRGSGQVTIERNVYKCVNCEAVDEPCFKCKAVSIVGEQGVTAVPMLLAKLGPMITDWVAERKASKQSQEAAARRAGHQARQSHQAYRPPVQGPQKF